jgi:hypothetical protein
MYKKEEMTPKSGCAQTLFSFADYRVLVRRLLHDGWNKRPVPFA